MNIPAPIKPGDKIGILATARRISPDHVESAIQILKEWGLEVILSPSLFSEDHSYLAGTDDQRRAALQRFIDDSDIKAILCARGGYGTTRIIDDIDFTQFTKNPKWIIGFSDVTSLHLKVAALGSQSIHATMPVLFSKTDSVSSIQSLRKVLFDQRMDLTAGAAIENKPGDATGILIGGNLSLLVDSLGTSNEPNTEGRILVLEEVDEYLYKIDRMIVQLKRARKLQSLAGMVIGYFSELKDTELPFGETFQEIIRFHTKEFSFPIGFNFPIGHLNPNLAWISGANASLTVASHGSILRSRE